MKKHNLARREVPLSHRVTRGKASGRHDPGDTATLKARTAEAKELLARASMADRAGQFYAQTLGVLVIFQAIDAAGKDGAIRHVMSGVNPQGCHVTSFKTPSSEELDHDYLWRYMRNVPARGQIGIFNRSYYEELLVVKVHRELLARQKMHPSLVTKEIWEDRYDDIRSYERYLVRNGVLVLKFFLHVSKAEQKRRFMERLDNPDKNWKFSSSDVAERQHWAEYQAAYQEAIRNTASRRRLVRGPATTSGSPGGGGAAVVVPWPG